MRGRWLSFLADGLLLLGLCLLFFWRDLTPALVDRRSFAAGDFSGQFYAFASYEASRLLSGHLPLWNPYTFAGHPFLADIQSAVAYPVSLAMMLLAKAWGFSYRTLELEALLHYPLVAFCTYLLARRLTGSRWGGIVAAAAFTFSGYLTSYPPLQLAILQTQAWLPLLLLLLDLSAAALAVGRRASAARWAVAAGLVVGVALLAGHPQSAILVIYAGLAFGLFRMWPRAAAGDWRAWRWPLGLLGMLALVGCGLAAIQLVPSWEFMRLSNRASIGYEQAGSGFTPYDLLQLILPAVGMPIPALYVGLLPLGLAVAALVWARHEPPACTRQPVIAFLGGGALLALLLSFGRTVGPLYSLFFLLVPGWHLFRGQERTIVWFVLAVALLAGYAIAWLEHRWAAAGRAPASLVRGYGLAASAMLALAVLCFVLYQAGNPGLWGFSAAALFALLILALAVPALRSRQPLVLLGLLLIDLFTINTGTHSGAYLPAGPFPPQPLLAPVIADDGVFRVANDGRMPANYGDVYRVEDIGGASPLSLERYQRLIEGVPAPRVWQLLNVKYVLSTEPSLPVPAEVLAQAAGADNQTSYLHRLRNVGPWAWLAGEIVAEPDESRLWQRLAATDFDPGQQVLLDRMPAGFQNTATCDGTVTWQARTPEDLALEVSSGRPCILVLSELDYPGWYAQVDGAAVPIQRADGVLRSLLLSAGQHQVTLRFRPASLILGALISAVTLVLAAGWLAIRRGPTRP